MVKSTSFWLAALAPAVLAGAATSARADTAAISASTEVGERRLIGGAFLGWNFLSSENELGNSVVDDQVPESAGMLGARLGYLLLPDLAPASALAPQLWLELEAKLTGSSTGEAPMSGRDSHFAPIFGWRAHGLLSLWSDRPLAPFAVVGVGGETMFTNSPFAASADTDGAFYWGIGGRYALTEALNLRADVRHVMTAGRFDSVAHQAEIGVAFERRFDLPFGRERERIVVVEREVPVPVAAEPSTRDSDGDGIPDHLDKCPNEPEVFNGIDDEDGCPEVDSDGDGLLGSRDQCPDAAEDFDGFEDDDGCPDPDNDGDGIPDVVDACPLQKEVFNGFEDDDGCPDIVPPEVLEYTGVVDGIKFASGSARITRGSRRTLDRAVDIFQRHPSVRIRIAGHTDDTGTREDNVELSRKRADYVKWYLVDKGVDKDRIETVGHGPDKPIADNATRTGRAKNRRIEFELLATPGTLPGTGAPEAQPAAPQTQPAAPQTQPAAPQTQPAAPQTQPGTP